MSAFFDRAQRYTAASVAALNMHVQRFWRSWLIVIVIFVAVFGIAYQLVLAAPFAFTPGTVVVLRPDSSLRADAQALAHAQIIRHPLVFELVVRLFGKGRDIQEGAYKFARGQNALTIAQRLLSGDFGIPTARITFYGGMSVREMAQKIAQVFPQISASDFIAAAQPYEGYLFPDTYTFSPSATAVTIVQTMRTNFAQKTVALQQEASSTRHSFADIVTMASLVQDEANTTESQRMVAGILWNRVKKGMPLQVDAVFGYIYGKQTYSPSLSDLQVNSPYNTYINAGLPPGPIGNPGLSALEAAAFPAKTSYLYYLTGKDGLMYYAVTYRQHLANERAYLGT